MPSARRETAILLLGDVILMLLSLWLALVVRSFAVPSSNLFFLLLRGFIFVYAVSLLVFYIAGLYERQTRLIKRILGIRILGAQAANTALAAILFFILPLAVAPKTVLALYLLISVVLISAWRFFVVPVVSIAERERAVLVGEGKAVDDVRNLVQGNPKYYLQFVEHFIPSELSDGVLSQKISACIANGVRRIVIDTRDPRVRSELPSLYNAMLAGSSFTEFSVFYEMLYDRVPNAHIDHAWLLEHLPHRNLPYSLAKRTLDVVGALVGIVVATPFIIGAAAIMYVFEGGNPFIWHERIGRGNKPFYIVKMRSMLINDHGDPELQKKNRVTGIGRFLRKTRIDELPQLWNILTGELSFIGPRPELPHMARIYEAEIPYYEVRHLITPGLSGWAQIYDYDAPRGGADVERTRRKLSYDMYYLKHRSFGLDLAIALKTLRALLSFSGT
jgi:lipopolysaccharide/colanic/teichoic acid biosynthesis glycosyltransferase